MNNDITNVVTKLLNNFLMIPFRSVPFRKTPLPVWILAFNGTERNLKKKNNGKYQNIILGYKKQANKPFH